MSKPLWVMAAALAAAAGLAVPAATPRSTCTPASTTRARRSSTILPIAMVMLMFLLIALLSIAMIDTAVGVVARVGRR